ncbi:MAG: hypothetical protein JJU12_03090 [Chlamydiales bacterium]|nr:hypothetical protein [Chlamydiales bacterium]
MCGTCPLDVNFRYSFFSSEFSIKRKIAAGAAIAIGVALAIIFGLGVAGLIPGINAPDPMLGLAGGTVLFLLRGFCLAGCKPRPSSIEEFTEMLEGATKIPEYVQANEIMLKAVGEAQQTAEKMSEEF